jgi:hypothetical protein
MTKKQKYESYLIGWQDAVSLNFMADTWNKSIECKESYKAGYLDGYTARKRMKLKAGKKYGYKPPVISLQEKK